MKKKLVIMLLFCLVSNLFIGCGSPVVTESNTEISRVYECDYKSLNINTKITTILDGEEISIVGNVFRLLTDPLTVKDSDGNVLGYAGDAYGIISQDDHGIYIGEEFDVNMCGNVDLFGESYKLKDSDGNITAYIEFNMSNTSGSITDTEGNLVATYSSLPFANDYTVTIYDNNICSDMSVLMIVASYVSDYIADR